MAYCTDAQLIAWVGVDPTSPEQLTRVAIVNAAATVAIDKYCGRTFTTDTSATARYFTPETPETCPIDDCWTITAVATDHANNGTWSQSWTVSTHYDATPVGNIGPAGTTGWPSTGLHAVGTLWFPSAYRPAVKVTAKWGWTATPADVTLAALLWGAELYKLHEAPFGTSWTSGDAQPSIRSNRPVRDLLQPYKRANAADARFLVA